MSTGTARITEGSLRFQDGENVGDRVEGHLRYHYSRRLFVQEVEPTDEGYVIRKEIDETRFEKWRGVADADESVEERMADLRGERE